MGFVGIAFNSIHRTLAEDLDMQKISYSKDVDALFIEISNEPIAYVEDEGQVILHYSQNGKLVLVEILDLRRFMSNETIAALSADLKAVIEAAIATHSNPLEPPQKNALEIFTESGFIGCIQADANLSTHYKSVVSSAVQKRFQRSQD